MVDPEINDTGVNLDRAPPTIQKRVIPVTTEDEKLVEIALYLLDCEKEYECTKNDMRWIMIPPEEPTTVDLREEGSGGYREKRRVNTPNAQKRTAKELLDFCFIMNTKIRSLNYNFKLTRAKHLTPA